MWVWENGVQGGKYICPIPSGSNHPHSSLFLRIFLPEYGLQIFTDLHGFNLLTEQTMTVLTAQIAAT